MVSVRCRSNGTTSSRSRAAPVSTSSSASGERVFGSLGRAAPRTVDIVEGPRTDRLALGDIVRLAPLGGTFWRRLDGSMSAGFSFTEANTQTQWTLDSSASYRSRRWLSELDARFAADEQRRYGSPDAKQRLAAIAALHPSTMVGARLPSISAERRAVAEPALARRRRYRSHPCAIEPNRGPSGRRRRVYARAVRR